MSGLATIRTGLVGMFEPKLVDELLAAYVEAKAEFFQGGLRLAEVEGGRFAEAAFRMLEQAACLPVTPLGRQLDTEKLIKTLANMSSSVGDSIRLHIPRTLRVIYDIRNKRDAAHLADGIDPNLQDATFVTACMDWVLAEFVRISHSVSAHEAHRLIVDVVTRRAPAVEQFDAFLKVLNPRLAASDRVLLLLYQCGSDGADLGHLVSWVKPTMRQNLRRTLGVLEHDKAYVHLRGDRYLITATGKAYVEETRLHQPRTTSVVARRRRKR